MVVRVRILASVSATAILAGALAGCATPPSAPGGGVPTTGSSSAAPSPCQPDGSGATRTITEADSGTSICLALGQRLEVYLHGTVGAMWAPVSLDGAALSAAANGKGTLPVGVTGGFFVGSATGDAHLRSSRSTCASASPAATPCGNTMFTVDVQVR